MPSFIRHDLTGQRFVRWTVLGPDSQATQALKHKYLKSKTKSVAPTLWKCRCACGALKSIRTHGLLSGTSRSCGCLRSQERTEKARQRKAQDFC